ncbi:hypothetical protein [Micromonospora sp. NPDC050695]|uniref:hypothetical protein n=1 Tax=Micromonospora sp. NPDC050695 TaxID=3154938 RepID=UPI0033C7F51B
MSRPDPSRSTALLIGTATHSQQALEDLPAVRANVTELARLRGRHPARGHPIRS